MPKEHHKQSRQPKEEKKPKLIDAHKANKQVQELASSIKEEYASLLRIVQHVQRKTASIEVIHGQLGAVVTKGQELDAADKRATEVRNASSKEGGQVKKDERGRVVADEELVKAENEWMEKKFEYGRALMSFFSACEGESQQRFGTGASTSGRTQSNQDREFVKFCTNIPEYVSQHGGEGELQKALDIVNAAREALDSWAQIYDFETIKNAKTKSDQHVQAWQERLGSQTSASIEKGFYEGVVKQLGKDKEGFKKMKTDLSSRAKAQKVEERLNKAMEDFRKLKK